MEAILAKVENLEARQKEITERGLEPLRASMERIKALSKGDEGLTGVWNEQGLRSWSP